MILKMMKQYLSTVRDATDKLLFGDMMADEWEIIVGDAVIIYMGSAFLLGAGVRYPDSLSDAGMQSFFTLFNRYLSIVDDMALEYKQGLESSVNFKSRVLLMTLGVKSSWLIGRELNGGIHNTEINI